MAGIHGVDSIANDNLLTRHSQITSNIEGIKEKKKKILSALQGISTSEEPDNALMEKLVAAFDVLSGQEQQYFALLQNIVGIHTRAVEDMESVQPTEEKKEEKKEETNEEDDEDQKEIEKTLREIREVAARAVIASVMNDKLTEQLAMHKSKKLVIAEHRKDDTSELRDRAREAFNDVEQFRKKVATERLDTQRKMKELSKLKKEAIEKVLGAEAAEETEEIDIGEGRLPPIEQTNGDEEAEEARVQAIKEEVKTRRERRDQMHAAIREKLVALEARKERMNEIRRILTRGNGNAVEEPVEGSDDTQADMKVTDTDDTQLDIETSLATASNNLRQLTAMRERLEALRASGEEPTAADWGIMRCLDTDLEKESDQ